MTVQTFILCIFLSDSWEFAITVQGLYKLDEKLIFMMKYALFTMHFLVNDLKSSG